MEAVKQAMGVIGAAVGALTALMTLYAKYQDIRKKAARDRRLALAAAQATMPAVGPEVAVPPPVILTTPAADALAVDRARALVRGPAIALLIAGVVSLAFNLFTAAFGYVDQFVTPLSTESQQKWEAIKSGAAPSDRAADDTTALLGVVGLLSFAVASAAAIWAGYGMLHLRSYWLSVAGSIAIMPGALVCCMAGVPVGAWSLAVLLRPEVAAAFR